MRNLTVSLIVSIITATFGLGWLISQIYAEVAEPADLPHELHAYQELAVDLAGTMDALGERAAIVEAWQTRGQHRLSLQDASGFPLPASLRRSFLDGEPLLLEADGLVSVYVYMPQSGQVLGLDVPGTEASQPGSSLDLFLTIGFYLGIALVIVIWLYPLISQLTRLRGAARQFGEGNLSARVEEKPHSYIGDIEREFNAMAARIQGLVSDNKLLSRAVSHDLKTPLARLRFGVDTLAEAQSPELREKYVERLNDDLNTMESLIGTLLEYARLDEANIEVRRQHVDLNEFVEQLLSPHNTADAQIRWVPAAEPAMVWADPRYLGMQLNNLVHNALQYASSQVLVTVSIRDRFATLTVEDDGPGFPEGPHERLLQPFQRGNREDHSGNHGMGLAITSKISQWFRAELSLGQSAELGGAKVELAFPVPRTLPETP